VKNVPFTNVNDLRHSRQASKKVAVEYTVAVAPEWRAMLEKSPIVNMKSLFSRI
jgi:hypothetical protein